MPKYLVTVHFNSIEIEFDTDDFDDFGVFKTLEGEEAPEVDPNDPEAVGQFIQDLDSPQSDLSLDFPEIERVDLKKK